MPRNDQLIKCLKSNLKSTDKERYQKFFSVFPTKSNSLIPNLGVRGHDIYCINIFAKLSSPYLRRPDQDTAEFGGKCKQLSLDLLMNSKDLVKMSSRS